MCHDGRDKRRHYKALSVSSREGGEGELETNEKHEVEDEGGEEGMRNKKEAQEKNTRSSRQRRRESKLNG